MKTKDIVSQMLTENTGRHILDSGGSNGRHWQRNQDRNFEAEPQTTGEFSLFTPYKTDKQSLDICITHNIYHWMIEKLDYNERVDSIFYDYAQRKSQTDLPWEVNIENFIKRFNSSSILDTAPMRENTYNGECLLSQTLLYTQFSTDFGDLVAIQVHNGADVR